MGLLTIIHEWIHGFMSVTSSPKLRIAETLLQMQYLANYMYRVPTWTGALDAIAIARIGAGLGQKEILPSNGLITKKDTSSHNFICQFCHIPSPSPIHHHAPIACGFQNTLCGSTCVFNAASLE
jgi:hypothetical protein